ncbi:hypothetical protein [Streptomyces syringium]|uniref:hypothetical protein n=1 Tax=Streptomyces syringium TaxID=76729 RepID=UPI003AAB9989
MSIMAVTTSAPLKPAAAEDFSDVVGDVFPVYEGVQNLTRIGVSASIIIQSGEIVATVSLAPEAVAAGLLPAIVGELEDPGVIRSKEGSGLLVTGSMAQGNVTVRVKVPEQYLPVARTGTLDAFFALLSTTRIDTEFLGALGADKGRTA